MSERDYVMRKEWNKPEVMELSIESTACGGWYPQKPQKPHKPSYPWFPCYPWFPDCPDYSGDDQDKTDTIS